MTNPSDSPPEWAMQQARESVAELLRRDGFVDADIEDVLSGKKDELHGIEVFARALAATAEWVERETIERCKDAIAAEKGPIKRMPDHEIQVGSWSQDECYDQISALPRQYKETDNAG
jgi:hypothetical protein